MPKPHLIHLVPTDGAFIPGVPAVECDVPEDRARELLRYRPAAFTDAAGPDGPVPIPPPDPPKE